VAALTLISIAALAPEALAGGGSARTDYACHVAWPIKQPVPFSHAHHGCREKDILGAPGLFQPKSRCRDDGSGWAVRWAVAVHSTDRL